MNRIRIGDINIDVTGANECPGRAIVQVRFCFVAEVPSSAGIATERSPVKWKTVENTPKRWFQNKPGNIHGIDWKSNQRDTHRRGPPVVDLHGNKAP